VTAAQRNALLTYTVLTTQ